MIGETDENEADVQKIVLFRGSKQVLCGCRGTLKHRWLQFERINLWFALQQIKERLHLLKWRANGSIFICPVSGQSSVLCLCCSAQRRGTESYMLSESMLTRLVQSLQLSPERTLRHAAIKPCNLNAPSGSFLSRKAKQSTFVAHSFISLLLFRGDEWSWWKRSNNTLPNVRFPKCFTWLA